MGGKAFAHADPPLETPRMPHAAYLEAKNTVIRRLSEKFHWINVPMEGPGKKDHGDVDVLVCDMNGIDIFKESVLDAISDALGAESRIIEGGSSHFAAHFAIPWPEHIPIPQAQRKATLLPPIVSITPPSPPGPSARSSLTITPGNLFKPSGATPTVPAPSTTTNKPPLDSTLPSPFGPHPNPLGSNPALYIKEASGPAEEDSKSKEQTVSRCPLVCPGVKLILDFRTLQLLIHSPSPHPTILMALVSPLQSVVKHLLQRLL